MSRGVCSSLSVLSKNDSPLHAACQTGCKQIVQLLLDNKVDYNQRNKSGNTPLHVACENGNSTWSFIAAK
jgi:ankyrin repeat protein